MAGAGRGVQMLTVGVHHGLLQGKAKGTPAASIWAAAAELVLQRGAGEEHLQHTP